MAASPCAETVIVRVINVDRGGRPAPLCGKVVFQYMSKLDQLVDVIFDVRGGEQRVGGGYEGVDR